MTSFLAGVALKSVVVLAAAWLITFLLRRRSAAARHMVWTAASAALLALPFLSLSLPALSVNMGRAMALPGIVFEATSTAAREAPVSHAAGKVSAASPIVRRTWRPDWRFAVILLWAAGAAVSLLRMLMAWTAIWRIRRASDRFPIADLGVLTGSLGLKRDVDVLESGAGSMPMSFGMLRPAILLPADAAEWTEERRRMVLLHELAHVRRGDFATHVLARTMLGVYWWNPLAWLAWRESLKERECAADDLVLTAGAPAADYAGHLLEIARSMQPAPEMEWAAVAMVRRSQLEGRLKSILDARVNRRGARRVSAWVAAMAAAAMVIPLAAVRAQQPQQSAETKLPIDIDAIARAAAAQKSHEILDKAARAAEALENYDTAQKLLESSLEVREDVAGRDSVDYGVGLLKLGELESRRGNEDQAIEFYTRAAAVLGNKPEAAPALIYLGFSAVRKKNFDQAIDYFGRAKLVDPAHAGEATMWMAVVRDKEKNTQEADQLFRQAMALAESDPGEVSTIMRVYAGFLTERGRNEEADSMRQQATALWKTRREQTLATARANAASDVYRIGNGVTSPSLVSKVAVQYTDEARAAKLQGTVVVYAEIGTDGVPRNLVVATGVGMGLDDKAIAAIRQWRFNPGMKDGVPVVVSAMIEVNFRLM